MGTGFAIVALGSGWIASAPDNLKAPRWVVVSAGLLFVFAGLSLLGPKDQRSSIAALLGAIMVSLFALVFSWVAFGSGQRRFSGTVRSVVGNASTAVSEWSGRTVFGLGAIALLLMSAWAWWRCYRLLRTRRSS
jgi:sulfite exporter TauE/SafE